ncbi:hypothetical protein Tco_0639330 [Tanacetum coccineum]
MLIRHNIERGSGEFSVASIRRFIDDQRLLTVDSKTLWIKSVPIKVNILAWKIKLEALPTRFNISRRDKLRAKSVLGGISNIRTLTPSLNGSTGWPLYIFSLNRFNSKCLQMGENWLLHLAIGDLHWTTVKNILKYLRNTKDMFLAYGGAVDWKSVKQSIFVTSSAEAEYIAAFDASKEAVWVRKFISGLGVVPTIEKPINMYCDNTGAIALANESGITKGARHFRAKVHYLREVIEFGDINRKIGPPLTQMQSNRYANIIDTHEWYRQH